jgi:hypothetical protein
MTGLSLSWREIPESLIERYSLQGRVIVRSEGGDREVRFMLRDQNPLLPVWESRQLTILPWAGKIMSDQAAGEPVDIPVTFGFDRGIWFQVREGFRGVVRNGRVFVLMQPASHYYRIMTRSHQMPVFIGEQM